LLIPFLFTGLGFVQLGLVSGFRAEYGLAVLVWGIAFGGSQWLLARRLPKANPFLMPAVSLLVGLGLLMTARLAPRFLGRQVIWLGVGIIVFLAITLIPRDLGWLRRYKYSWLLAGLVLLSLTFSFGVNPSGFGARLWLGGGGLYFQPSEPLKILFVVFLAVYLSDRRRQMLEVPATVHLAPFGLRLNLPHPAYFGPLFLVWGFSILLLFWQRDLGAALLFFCTFLGMLYVAIGRIRYLLIGSGLLMVAMVLGYRLFPYVAARVESWWNPWLDPDDTSFQIVQSLLAFASGGWFGQGLGQGLPTAIPVVHTDFVFAAIGEEYGMLGALAVLLCFGVIIHQALEIGLRGQTHFQQLLAAGLGLILGIQALVIAAGSLKLIPLTGVTMPFVSYGGSSLLTSFAMVGLLVFISTRVAPFHRSSFIVSPGPFSFKSSSRFDLSP
jgi:cell division protein FtsW